MERPTCKTCPYWKGYAMKTQSDQAEGLFDDLRLGDFLTGHCHLKAPYIFMQAETDLEECQAVFPLTWFDAFCGQHPNFPAYIASLAKGD